MAEAHLHWWPRIQISGTGLTLMAAFGPTLNIPIPYLVRATAFAAGCVMVVWPVVAVIWEKTTPATWTPDRKVDHGKTRAVIAIVAMVCLVAAVYFAQPVSPNITEIAFELFGHPLAPSIAPTSVPAPEATPNAILQSSDGKILFRCNLPRPSTDSATALKNFYSQFPIFQNEVAAWGDIFGYTASAEIIRDGMRITIEASSPEAKERVWRATGTTLTKIVVERHRINDFEIVSLMVEIPGISN